MAANLKLDNALSSNLAAPDVKAQANRVALAALMAELRAEEDKIRNGGGQRPQMLSAPRAASPRVSGLSCCSMKARSSWNWAFGPRTACMPTTVALRARAW